MAAAVPGNAAPGDEAWVAAYNGPGNGLDELTAMATSPGGGVVYVTGLSGGTEPDQFNNRDFATVAYDSATGAQIWEARYDGPNHFADHARDIAVSPDGSKVFVTGESYMDASASELSTAFATVAYDAATGAQLWARRFDRAGDLDLPCCIGVSPSGARVFVTGDTSAGTNGWQTLAYDATTGALQWRRLFDPGDEVNALAVSPDGSRIYLAGSHVTSRIPNLETVFQTVAYSAGTGTKLWGKRYDAPGERAAGYSLGLGPNGSRVFMTGTTVGFGSEAENHAVTIAYAALTGAVHWIAQHPSVVASEESFLAVDPLGTRVFVATTGSVQPLVIGRANFLTIAYDLDSGLPLWEATFDSSPLSPLLEQDDFLADIAVTAGGTRVIVVGTSCAIPDSGCIDDETSFVRTVAYGAVTGDQLWTGAYRPGPDDSVRGIAVTTSSTQGLAFVGAQDPGFEGGDYLTIAYEI
jgi:outer membrane protein assembly factor BamB